MTSDNVTHMNVYLCPGHDTTKHAETMGRISLRDQEVITSIVRSYGQFPRGDCDFVGCTKIAEAKYDLLFDLIDNQLGLTDLDEA